MENACLYEIITWKSNAIGKNYMECQIPLEQDYMETEIPLEHDYMEMRFFRT